MSTRFTTDQAEREAIDAAYAAYRNDRDADRLRLAILRAQDETDAAWRSVMAALTETAVTPWQGVNDARIRLSTIRTIIDNWETGLEAP